MVAPKDNFLCCCSPSGAVVWGMKITDEMVKALSLPGTSADMEALKRCMCHKMLRVDERVRRWHSGIVNYDEVLCKDCRKEFADKSRIVCLGCRKLQGFINPTKASTGFTFESKKHYHIAKCPRCDNSVAATPVLEHERWCRDAKLVTKTNFDLLQEIEQKTLQGKRAANKLREEINFPTQ